MSEVFPVAGDPEQISSAVEQAPFLFLVCEGPQLRLVAANATVRAFIPGRDVLGRPWREGFADLLGQHLLEQYERVYETGEPMGGREWRMQLTQPDGSIREVYATFTLVPWRDPNGSVRGVIAAGMDVTEVTRARMSAEDDLRVLKERYARSREVVAAVQRELLPFALPVLPRFRIGASYLPAESDASAGGDWFDAVTQPSGRLAVVVGDVVGHGVSATALMAQLRAVLHERLAAGASIAEALTALDRLAVRLPAARAATVCVAIIDPWSGSVSYCTAGHPPPLLVTGDRSRYLPVSGAGPLGTGSAFPARTAVVADGEMLVLYSDGLLKRPRVAPSAAAADLARVAAAASSGGSLHDPGSIPVDWACTQTVELLVRTTGHRDDVTLLAVQRVSAGPDLQLRMPAALSALRMSRAAFSEWLEQVGASDDDRFRLLHAVGEMVSNAIEHGRPAEWDEHAVTLQVLLGADGLLTAVVNDRGSWRDPALEAHRGRGLAMAAALVDDLRVEPGSQGTRATIRHRLTRPVRLLNSDRVSVPAPRNGGVDVPRELVVARGSDDRQVRVEGPIDIASAGRLRRELTQHARGGVRALTVDLSGVTLLASEGVSLLHDLVAHLGSITLYAPAGSPAQQVMSLVALPHVTDVGSPAR